MVSRGAKSFPLFLLMSMAAYASIPTGTDLTYETSNTLPPQTITPQTGPHMSRWSNWMVEASALVWQAEMEGLEFAQAGVSTSGAVGEGHVGHLSSNFKPGFRAGVGLNFRHDGWETLIDYTWFQNLSSNGQMGPSNPSLVNTISTVNSPGGSIYSLSSASAHWKVQLNTLDWELARSFYLSRYFTLRPFTGLKAAWIYQHYNVDYLLSTNPSFSQIQLKHGQQLRGVGIRSGLDASWLFASHWALYGNLALTALWGSYHCWNKETDYLASSSNSIISAHTRDEFHTIKPVIEWGIGLTWQLWFWSHRYRFACQAGWEEQIWINNNQFLGLLPLRQKGDLTFQGLTVTFRLDF